MRALSTARHGQLTSTSSAGRLHNPARQGLRDLPRVDLEQVRDKVAHALVLDLRVALLVGRELDVSDPEDGREHAEDAVLLLLRETDDLHGLQRLGPVGGVVDAGDFEAAGLGDVGVGFGPLQAVRLPLSGRSTLGELVEDVEVALVLDLPGDAVLVAAKGGWSGRSQLWEVQYLRTFSRR